MFHINFNKSPEIRFQCVDVPDTPGELDAWLAQREAQVPGVKPGNQKGIVWADPAAPARTPVSIISLHGFTASRGETRPLCDTIAARIGANLFYTRLTGHGTTNGVDAIGDAKLNDWIYDTCETYAIGRTIGDRVVVTGVSFGGLLAVWLAAQPEAVNLQALILMSPAFQLKEKWKQVIASCVMLLPWSVYFIHGSFGKYRKLRDENDKNILVDRYYTTPYPSSAILEVIQLMNIVDKRDLSTIMIPVLLIYSSKDERVCPRRMMDRFDEFGSIHKKRIEVHDTNDTAGYHILAGDIWSPGTTETLAEDTALFIQNSMDR